MGLFFSTSYLIQPALAGAPAEPGRPDPSDLADSEQFAAIVGRFEANSDACGRASRETALTVKARAAVVRRFRDMHLGGADAYRAIQTARRAARLAMKWPACSSARQEELIITNAISKEQDPDWRASEPLAQ